MPDQGKLRAYAELVRSSASRLNLVSPGDVGVFEERHITDSLRLVPLLDSLPPGPCIDVGSGAGLPGIPLAIAGGRSWRLLEPRRRRAAFLEDVVRELELDCEIDVRTAEQATRDPAQVGAYVCATARALAAPHDAFGLILPFVAPEGRAVVFFGEGSSPPPRSEVWKPGIAIMRPPDRTT